MATVRHISVLLLAVLLAASCRKDAASEIEGDYTLQAQSVQINGVIINLGDWPGASASIIRTGEGTADVTVDSLLLGLDRITVPCSVSSEDRNIYSFSGQWSGQDRNISLDGTVRKGSTFLSIADTCISAVTGRWKPAIGEDGLAEISISFHNPAITVADSTLDMIGTMARVAVTLAGTELGYIELSPTGYVNIDWNGPVSSDIEPLLNGVIQYYTVPDSSALHLYLRRAIADGAGLPVSPVDIAMSCSVSGESLSLTIDQDAIRPWTEMLSSYISGLTYDDIAYSGLPFADGLTEDDFNRTKSAAVLASGVLAMPSTHCGLTITLNHTE